MSSFVDANAFVSQILSSPSTSSCDNWIQIPIKHTPVDRRQHAIIIVVIACKNVGICTSKSFHCFKAIELEDLLFLEIKPFLMNELKLYEYYFLSGLKQCENCLKEKEKLYRKVDILIVQYYILNADFMTYIWY